MSPKSDEFHARAVEAERYASDAADPEVKQRFLDIARSWHALAEMVERGKGAEVLITTRRHDRP
jgi:hypothetical protein